LTIRFSDVGLSTFQTPLSLLILCNLSFSSVSLTLSSVPTYALKLLTTFLCGTLGIERIHELASSKDYPLNYDFNSQLVRVHSRRKWWWWWWW